MQLPAIQKFIYTIREQNIILDFDLAKMYCVETRVLKQAVKRNIDRFPKDFMFQLTKSEWHEVITTCDNLSKSIKFSPVTPLVFTEQGVAMLSSVLRSNKAIQVNIAIMRAFVFMRQYALSHQDLTNKLKNLDMKYNKQFQDIYQAINYLIQKNKLEDIQKNRRQIGFK